MQSKTIIIASLLTLTALAGCTAPPQDGQEDAQVAFYVKDAPADEFESVFVSFNKVEVHKTGGGQSDDSDDNATATTSAANVTATNTTTPANTTSATNATATNTTATSTSAASEAGWITLVDTNQTVDLKAFQGDARAFLGEANITAGKYTQIRIHVTQAYGMMNGTQVNFTLPSGKLKITGPWDATAGEATQLIVDFQLEKSIHKTGQDKYMFKPTMKLIVEHKQKLDSSDTEEPSAAANRTKSSHGKPSDKGKPGSSTNTTSS